MKFIVDQLPDKCEQCDYCADAIMQTPLGVPKPVSLCTLMAILIPQRPDIEPKTIDKTKTPWQNGCLCQDKNTTVAESGIIL